MTDRQLWLCVWLCPTVAAAAVAIISVAINSTWPLILAAFVVGVWIGGAEW